MFDFLKITSDEFDESLIDFRGNRSQFSTGRPVFLRAGMTLSASI